MKPLALLLLLTVFGCSDYDPANYTIERNGLGQYRVRQPFSIARDISDYEHMRYLSSYRPYPWPFSSERGMQPILFPDSLSAERAIREHIAWLNKYDSLREVGKWRTIR